MRSGTDAVRWLSFSLLALACHGSEAPATAPRPNVLWVVWDTVRADRLSLYGHERTTTPKLEAWAENARVFTNVTSAASSTVPSHGSMFTGLLPGQHGAFAGDRRLDDSHETVAERFQASGYRTFLWAANPHLSAAQGFTQGFEVAQHPWDAAHRERAMAIVRSKVLGDRSSELAKLIQLPKFAPWVIKAAGALAAPSLVAWLDASGPERPFFAFLNYMEAHQPYIPGRRYREKMMSPEQVARSYQIDRSWDPIWSYTLGLGEYTEDELEVFGRTYDATLLELDDLFADLLASLDGRGHLDDTIVVLTADHGEHLGEHHMLDHQYSVYEPVLRVPLVLHYPPRVPAGRDDSPVMNLDIQETLLELAGIARSDAVVSRTLLAPDPERKRVSQYPSVLDKPFEAIRRLHPGWQPGRWAQRLNALYEGDYKLILAEDGHRELYDLARDPLETQDLAEREAARAERMGSELARIAAALLDANTTPGSEPELSDEQRKMLEALGYLAPDAEQ